MTNNKKLSRQQQAIININELMWAMRSRIRELENTLHDCVDVLDNYTDADSSDGELIPNKAMRMQMEAKHVLAFKEDW